MGSGQIVRDIYINMGFIAVIGSYLLIQTENVLSRAYAKRRGGDPDKFSRILGAGLIWLAISCVPALLCVTTQVGWLVILTPLMMIAGVIGCGIYESRNL